jgi:hypothetical protein
MLPRKVLLNNTLFRSPHRSPYKTTRRNMDADGFMDVLTAAMWMAVGAGAIGGLALYFAGSALWNTAKDYKIVKKDEEDNSHHNQKGPGK